VNIVERNFRIDWKHVSRKTSAAPDHQVAVYEFEKFTCTWEHRASVLPLLGMISWRLGRSIDWDGANERITNDDAANKLLSRPYREPWVYPVG